jgi:hypothetical protein
MRYANGLAVLGVAALVAGCGSAQTGQRATPAAVAARAAAAPAATAVPDAAPAAAVPDAAPAVAIPVAPDAAPDAAPQQQAAASAEAMLAAFIPPPHAVRTGPLPVSRLARPGIEPMGPDRVTQTGWWRVTGQPLAVVGWIRGHKLPGSPPADFGGLTVHGSHVMWDADFTLPAVPGVLASRELVVSIAADGPNRTAIRADAFVGWVPARTAAETIPASAMVVTITPVAGQTPFGHQVTVTDPALVARIAAAVNALPLYPPRGPMWCDILVPASGSGGEALRLTFRAGAGSRALAVVTAVQDPCPVVEIVIDGKTMPSLNGAQTLIQRVMAIAGYRWPGLAAPSPTAP